MQFKDETLKTAATYWLEDIARQHYSLHTLSAYQRAIERFADFMDEGGYDWRHCPKKIMERFVFTLLELDGLKVASVKQYLTAINKFYQFIIKTEPTITNPVMGYRLKNTPRPLPTIADVDIMTRLLEQTPPEDAKQRQLWQRDKAIFELAYSSGLRLSELVELDVADVDMIAKTVRVLGKGNKERIVPVGKQALLAIQDYLPLRASWRCTTPALFISQQGKRLSPRAIQLRLKISAKMAGIELNLYPHLLRHCFASHLLSASGDIRAIQEMLGHEDIRTTQIYTHVDFAALTQIYDKAHPRAHKTTKGNG